MLTLMHEHPEITFRRDAALCSINDRLGALLCALAPANEQAPGVGMTLTPLGRRYIGELIEFAVANSEDVEADLEEALRRNRHGG